MKGRRAPSQTVKIDAKKLRDAIVTQYSLSSMAKILGRGVTYFSPSADRDKRGIELNDLEKICMILGREVSEFIVLEPEVIVDTSAVTSVVVSPPEDKPAETNQRPMSDAGITALRNIYEGVELNGQALGKLISAVEANTAALNTLIEEFRKTGTTVTNWSQKWCNHKKYGRF